MKNLLAGLIVVSLLAAGCGKQEELENKNTELQRQLAMKDKFIEEVTASIDEIHDQLEHTWVMEQKIVRSTATAEKGKPATHAEMVHEIIARIGDIDSTLAANRKKLSILQGRINSSNIKYAGLQKLVEDLRSTLAEREQSIAELQGRVQTLQTQVQDNNRVIAMQDSSMQDYTRQISKQTTMLNTAYYVVGKRNDLKGKGIITNEGGFLWGLLGATTVVSPKYDNTEFVQFNKLMESSIEVPGEIDELVPKRDTASYAAESTGDGHTVLKITNPADFWRNNHLVVISR